ncbi:hypothetical protein BU17DRAFT_72186 [Hysterangium stoloniferum]|nr:hypothetical protein BU17DRAFT_72186 [Hysterangium stoloniferum]
MPFLSKLSDSCAKIKLRSSHSPDVLKQRGETYNDPGFGIKELSTGTTLTIDYNGYTASSLSGFSSIADDPEAKSKGIKKSPEAVLKWLTAIQKKCRIIFDNADGMDKAFEAYLQQMEQIHVLINSHNPGLANHVTESMNVVSMESDEALVLFQAAAKSDKESNATIQELSKKIVARLGCLPPAIDIAGATISSGLSRMSEFLMMHENIKEMFLMQTIHP